MKKIMSLVLALALVLSMGVTVFADENSGSTTVTDPIDAAGNSKDINVTAGYTAPTYKSAGTVYHVVIGWKQTGTITYKDASYTYTWNAEQTKYETPEEAKTAAWTVSGAAVEITVTNKSNAAITATCAAPAAGAGITTFTGHYGDGTDQKAVLECGSAAPATITPNNLEGKEVSKTATYTITNVDGKIGSDNAVIATINVSISAN